MDDLARFHDGDRELFRSLVVEHGPRVLRIARGFAPDEAAAEDMFQEIWTRVWLRRTQYSGEGSFTGWLHALARHECVSRYRKERSARDRVERLHRAALAGAEVRAAPLPAVQLERAELRARLLEAMTILPARQREAVELRLLEGLPAIEAADSMGCTPATVRSLLRNGLARLRTVLGDLKEEGYGVS